MFLRKN